MRTLLVISVGYCVDDICLLFMIISFALGLGRYFSYVYIRDDCLAYVYAFILV